MELWTLDPNIHLSSMDTLFCLITCLFALFISSTCFVCPHLALFISMFFACSSYLLCFFLCLFVGLFPCLLQYMHGAMVRPPRRKRKGHGCKQEDASPQRAMFSRLGGLALLKWFSLSLFVSHFFRACLHTSTCMML